MFDAVFQMPIVRCLAVVGPSLLTVLRMPESVWLRRAIASSRAAALNEAEGPPRGGSDGTGLLYATAGDFAAPASTLQVADSPYGILTGNQCHSALLPVEETTCGLLKAPQGIVGETRSDEVSSRSGFAGAAT